MVSGCRLTRKRFRSLFAIAALTIGLLAAASTIAAARAGNRAGTTGAAPPVVAVVDSVSGPLSVRHGPGGPLRSLHKGGRLQLGDTVVPGRGAAARLSVHRPAAVPPETGLFFIKPAPGAHPAVLLSGTPSHLIVTIRP
jgi:hypothetical protein